MKILLQKLLSITQLCNVIYFKYLRFIDNLFTPVYYCRANRTPTGFIRRFHNKCCRHRFGFLPRWLGLQRMVSKHVLRQGGEGEKNHKPLILSILQQEGHWINQPLSYIICHTFTHNTSGFTKQIWFWSNGTLVPEVFFRHKERISSDRQRSGEKKPLVTRDANLTIMLR